MDQFIKLNSLAPLDQLGDLVLLIVRIAFGIVFLIYGFPKLKNLKSNANDFEHMGFKPGWLFGTPVALLETFGSVAIILGFFTWLVAIGFAVHMLIGMIWKITKTDKPFTDWSYDLLLLLIALMLLVTGPGAYNILFV